jgi:uncharacterized membrane protein SpoIIM required for sporulation
VAAISLALLALFTSCYFLVPRFELLGMLYASVIAVVCLYFVYAATLLRKGFPLGISKTNAAALAAVFCIVLILISGL